MLFVYSFQQPVNITICGVELAAGQFNHSVMCLLCKSAPPPAEILNIDRRERGEF